MPHADLRYCGKQKMTHSNWVIKGLLKPEPSLPATFFFFMAGMNQSGILVCLPSRLLPDYSQVKKKTPFSYSFFGSFVK